MDPLASQPEIQPDPAGHGAGGPAYVLRLYVAGLTPRSVDALAAVKRACEENLEGHYDLEVVNIQDFPERAKEEQIIAVPTLIRKLPLPLRRLIGDMADTEKLLVGLGLQPTN